MPTATSVTPAASSADGAGLTRVSPQFAYGVLVYPYALAAASSPAAGEGCGYSGGRSRAVDADVELLSTLQLRKNSIAIPAGMSSTSFCASSQLSKSANCVRNGSTTRPVAGTARKGH